VSSVWYEPDRYDPQSFLFMSDSKLKVIHDLRVVGTSRAMTEGIISAMKALEIAVPLNNSFTEDVVRSDVAVKERDNVVAMVAKLEADLAGLKTGSE
jgi:hypothetical protein